MTLRPLISALAVALLATAASAHPAFAVIGGMPGSIPSLTPRAGASEARLSTPTSGRVEPDSPSCSPAVRPEGEAEQIG
jgi:hypothetical protein